MTHFSIFNPDRWRSAFLDRKIAAPIRDEPDVNTSERQPQWRRTRQPRKPRRRAMTDLTDFVNVMASAEDWLAAGASDRETAAPPGEPMKRFTIDVPVSLHRRIKTACARRGLKTSSVLRDLLKRVPRHVRAIPLAAVIIRDEAPAGVPVPDNQYPPGNWCQDHGGQGD
jgi:hypothetical protein